MEKESSPGRVLSKLMLERKTAIRLHEDEAAKHTQMMQTSGMWSYTELLE